MKSLGSITPQVRQEYTNPDIDLKAPTPSIIDAFGYGTDMYKSELQTQLKEKHEIDSLAVDYPDEPTISVEEQKEKYDFTSDRPLTIRQVILSKKYLKEEHLRAERFGSTAFDITRPAHSISTWIGAGLGMTLDMYNIAADVALIAAPPLLIAKKAGQYIKLAKYMAKMDDALKLSKLAHQVKKTKTLNKLRKQAKHLQDIGTAAFKNAQVRNLARVGTANALVELGIHNIEASKGNHYALGSAVAMGFFAPAFFRGAIGALGVGARKAGVPSSFRKATVKAKAKTAKPVAGFGDVKAKMERGEPLSDVDIQRITKYDPAEEYNQRDIKDDLPIDDRWDMLARSDTPEELISKLEKATDDSSKEAIRQLKTVLRGREVFGEAYEEALTRAGAGLILDSQKVDFFQIHPWMKNVSQWNKRFEEALKNVHGDKGGLPNKQVLDNMFETTEEALEAYKRDNALPKRKTGDDYKPNKIEDIKKRQDKAVVEELNSDSPEMAQFSKELTDSLEELKGCILRGGKSVS